VVHDGNLISNEKSNEGGLVAACSDGVGGGDDASEISALQQRRRAPGNDHNLNALRLPAAMALAAATTHQKYLHSSNAGALQETITISMPCVCLQRCRWRRRRRWRYPGAGKAGDGGGSGHGIVE